MTRPILDELRIAITSRWNPPGGRSDYAEIGVTLRIQLNRDGTVAGMMITVPSTLGLFERQILDVIKAVHDAGGLMYMDGAHMNALMGVVKPGELGFDVMHYNLHKTFSTPHGGGGPGCCVAANKDKYVIGTLAADAAVAWH